MIGLWPFKPRRSGKVEVMLGECFQKGFKSYALGALAAKLYNEETVNHHGVGEK